MSQPTPVDEEYQYDPNRRKLAKPYRNTKLLAELVSGLVVQVGFCILFLASGLSASLWSYATSLSFGGHVAVGFYVLIFLALLMLVQMPVAWYDGYLVEHKFGLSHQKTLNWLQDYGKVFALTLALSIPLTVGLYALIPVSPLWWLWASIIYAGLELVGSTILPLVVVPMFYKLRPYDDQAQRSQLLGMARRAGARNIERVMLANESARSAKANAFFTGLGKTRTMVLFDNLVGGFTPKEVLTVVAHELAHYVNKDIWREAALSAVLSVPELYVANELLKWSTGKFGISGAADPTGFPLILTTLAVVGFVLMPISNTVSRTVERQADEFALRVAEEPEAQASTERRLADMNLSDDTPHWLVELFFYTHPPASKRVRLAEEWKTRASRHKAAA